MGTEGERWGQKIRSGGGRREGEEDGFCMRDDGVGNKGGGGGVGRGNGKGKTRRHKGKESGIIMVESNRKGTEKGIG